MTTRSRFLSSAVMVVGTLAAGAVWAGEEGHYLSQIHAALAQSGAAKPVLVDFYADW